jgi:enamine deaminase RidA (YjgF/YER057c/UK114 family)
MRTLLITDDHESVLHTLEYVLSLRGYRTLLASSGAVALELAARETFDGFPKTAKRLREAGIATRKIDVLEFEKAEGGITCLALLLEPRSARIQPASSGVTAIRANGVPAPPDASPHAVVSRGTVYIAPVRPFDPTTVRRRRVPAKEQMEHALRNLSVVLGNAGSSPDRVLRITLHVADPKLVDEVEEVYARMFGQHRPARSVIGNPALPAGILVEIEAVAAVADGAG